MDGDTFWIDGAKVRVADIDVPETHPPRCAAEARLGDAATLRLQALLNAGAVTLAPVERERDSYSRLLRVVERRPLARWRAGGGEAGAAMGGAAPAVVLSARGRKH